MEDISSLKERLAKLELLAEMSKEDRDLLKIKMQNIVNIQRKTDEDVQKILRKIERYEGKFGGILLTVGAVVSFFVMIGKFIWSNWEQLIAWLKT